jgi:hypothetical protein
MVGSGAARVTRKGIRSANFAQKNQVFATASQGKRDLGVPYRQAFRLKEENP